MEDHRPATTNIEFSISFLQMSKSNKVVHFVMPIFKIIQYGNPETFEYVLNILPTGEKVMKNEPVFSEIELIF